MLDNLLLDGMHLSCPQALEAANESIKIGFKKLWVTEGSERDAFGILASLASLSAPAGVEVGTNLTNVFSRTPLLIAMSSITLSEVANGRCFLTLGTGGIGYVEKCHGLSFESPLKRVREYLILLRKMLQSKPGERIVFQGEFFKVDFRIRSVPREPIPMYCSALNPKMIQLAGELADGVVLSHMPLQSLDSVKQNLKIGAERSGRESSKIVIFSNLPASVDDPEGIESLRKMIAFHIAAPTYQYLLELAGFGDRCKEIRNKWESGKVVEATELVSDDLVYTVSLGYNGKSILKRIQDYETAGVIPILYPAARQSSSVKDVITLARTCRKNGVT